MKASQSRHGFKSIKSRVLVQGLSAIDKRTLAAQALLEWKDALVADLGGDVSTQQLTLIEMAVRTRLLVEHVDAFILSQSSLVNKKRRQIYPIVRERQHLVDSLARLLKDLGLARVAKSVGTLEEYLQSREAERESEPNDSGSDGGRKDFREDVPSAVGEGHIPDVADIPGGVVRATDDGGTVEGISEIHGQE